MTKESLQPDKSKEQQDRELDEAELGKVSGGAEPVGSRVPKPAEPVGAPKKAEPVNN